MQLATLKEGIKAALGELAALSAAHAAPAIAELVQGAGLKLPPPALPISKAANGALKGSAAHISESSRESAEPLGSVQPVQRTPAGGAAFDSASAGIDTLTAQKPQRPLLRAKSATGRS